MRLPVSWLFLSAGVASCSQQSSLDVEDAWARDTAGRTVSAAVFMTIRSSAPDRLVSASTPAAARTDLMTTTGGRGAMQMTYVKAIDLPADKPVSLDPGGLHVWLASLKEPLEAGRAFPVVLEFEKAGKREVTVSVIAPAAAPPMSGKKT